jgi:hypothetical protein
VSETARLPRQHVFVDTEYDQLDTGKANLLEVAYAAEDGPIVCGVPPHTLEGAEPKALEVNRYFERDLGNKAIWDRDIVDNTARATAGQTVVGANVRVDAHILSRFIGYEPWHYRLCDVESAAYLLLDFDQMPGLREIKNKLTELGYELPDPDHSAGGDVETLRAVFRILQRIARYYASFAAPTPEQVQAREDAIAVRA